MDILTYMRENVAEHVDMLESLRHGAEVVYRDEDALLLLDAGTYMLAALDDTVAKRALEALPRDATRVVVRDGRLLSYLIEGWGLNHVSRCVQIYYPVPLPEPRYRLRIEHPRMEDWDAVRSVYHLIDEDDLYEHFCSEDFFCAYWGEQLVGFAGVHSEGAMGMLFVFPEMRRQGFAEELTAFTVNRQIALGRYAYAQAFVDNDASISLQHKMHATVTDGTIWWMIRE